MATIIDEHPLRKKRIRIPQVCNSCRKKKVKCDKERPKCSNCSKTGFECVYADFLVVHSAQPQPKDEQESLLNFELLQENKKLREALKNLRSLQEVDNGEPSLSSSLYDGIYVDFYEGYSSLSLKNSCHEDHKPLDIIAAAKKDPYVSFFTGFMILTMKLNANATGNHWKLERNHGRSKWMRLLDTEKDDHDLQESMKTLSSDRLKLFKMNIFPLLSSDFSSAESSDYIREQVENSLPSQRLGTEYLRYFFDTIWPLRPWIDEEKFRERLNQLISYDDEKPKIKILLRHDLCTVAIYLIIIRYSSVAIQLMTVHNPLDYRVEYLRRNAIPVGSIVTAQLCLSCYRLARKTSLEIVQALLYLRIYFRDCPEDGDSIRLTQSQNIYGFIVQSAVSIGLNRDPDNYAQSLGSTAESNLRRRIWHSIVEIDVRTAALAGTFSTLPDPSYVSVKFPDVSKLNTLEQAQKHDMEKAAKLNELYLSISKLINNTKKDSSLSSLIELMNEADEYFYANFNTKGMTSIRLQPLDSVGYKVSNYRNMSILSRNLIHLSYFTQVHKCIITFAEQNTHLHTEIFKVHLSKKLDCMRQIYDLSCGYLLGCFSTYITHSYDFEILPLIDTAISRSMMSDNMSLILRLYHTIDLFENTDIENKVGIDLLNEFVDIVFHSAEYIMSVYRNHVAKKYYSGLKMLASSKYAIKALKAYKFKSMTRVINFLSASQNGSDAKTEELRALLMRHPLLCNLVENWTPLDTRTKDAQRRAIVNVNSTNILTDLDAKYIQECIQKIKGPYVYCPDFPTFVSQSPRDPLFLETNNIISDVLDGAFSAMKEPRVATSRSEPIINADDIGSTLNYGDYMDDDLEIFNQIFDDLDNNGVLLNDSMSFF